MIELLTIICILGVIILIAVPNNTKLVAETKEKIFDTSSTNLIKTMEEECKSNLITKDRTTLSYSIIDGKIDSNLDVKGTIPDDGYVILDNKCNVKDYYLKYEDLVFSNGEDMRNDYMLASTTGDGIPVFYVLYSDYYSNIANIYFVDNLNIPEGALEVKDPSCSGKEKIKSWLIQNGTNYDLYVGADSTIYSNYNSINLFADMSSLTNIEFDNFDTSFVTNMSSMFAYSYNITELDISSFDTSNVTDMSWMFYNCSSLTQLDLSSFDTSKVNSMIYMFGECFKLTSLDLSNFNTSKVTDMAYMFYGCNNIINIYNINVFNTKKVIDMEAMFYECYKLKQLDLSKFNTNNVENKSYMFYSCHALTTIGDISGWTPKNLKGMRSLFCNCNSLKSVDVSNFNTSQVENMEYVFDDCHNMTSIGDISNWDTGNVITISRMFSNAQKLTSLDLSKWDTSLIYNMYEAFYNCSSLKSLDISNWDFGLVVVAEDAIFQMLTNNSQLSTITMKNSDYNSVNKLIGGLLTRTAASPGTLTITGIDDNSKVSTSTATSKYWNIVV